MKVLMNLVFILGLSFAATAATAAALCPPDSCNIHNGCMDGCTTKTAYGSTVCNDQDPKSAERLAQQEGTNYAHRACYYGFFMTSQWMISTHQNGSQCEVQARASFSCFQ